MPYVVACPNCPARLKSQQPVPAGRTVTCPQCKKPFTLAEAAPLVSDGSVTLPAPAAPTPPAKPTPPPPAPKPAKKAEPEVVDGADFEFEDKPKKSKVRWDDEEDDRPKAKKARADDGDDFAFDDKSKKGKKSRDDDDEDDRPRSKKSRDDDEDDRPRSKKSRDDDEDDRPRSKKSRDEDGDDFAFDDKPKKGKKSRDDDEEDDRPRSKKSRDDDEDDDRPKSKKAKGSGDFSFDDEDDRPKSKKRRTDDDEDRDGRHDDDNEDDRPRKKKGKKGNNKVLLLALIGGAGAFALLGVLLLVLNLAGVFTLFGGGSSDMMAWAPSDSQIIMFVDYEQASKFGASKGIGRNNDVSKYGLTESDVATSLGAGRNAKSDEPDVTILKLKNPADKSKITQKIGGAEATSNGKTYHKGGTYCAHFPSSDIVVLTKGDSTMVSLLQKENKVTVSEDMKSATGRCRGAVWVCATGTAAPEADILALMSGFGDAFGGFGKGGIGPKASPPKTKSFTMMMSASGNTGEMKMESTYDTADAAKRVADGLQKAIDMGKKEKVDGSRVDVSQSGSTVSLTSTGPLDAKNKGVINPFGMGF